MKKVLLLLAFMSFGLMLQSCGTDGEQNIDKTAQEAKNFLDEFGNKAGDILEISKDKLENSDETISKLKQVIDKVAAKTKGVSNKIENDPDLKQKLMDTKNTIETDATDIIKDLESILNEFIETKDSKKVE